MKPAVTTAKQNNKQKKNGDQETSKAGKKKPLERCMRSKINYGAEIFPEIFSSRRNHLFFPQSAVPTRRSQEDSFLLTTCSKEGGSHRGGSNNKTK